jgi:hypothetical protein
VAFTDRRFNLRKRKGFGRKSLEEMYDFCINNKLPNAWVYYWNSGYRPGRCHIWERSTYYAITIYRTTMRPEAFNEFLRSSGRGILVDVLEVIDRAGIP